MMMKQLISIMAMAMGASLVSSAAVAGAPDGTFSGKTTILQANCIMLSQDTTIGVSKGVTAGYQCFEVSNMILTAACHEGGSRNTPVTCTRFDHDNDTTTEDLVIGEGCTLAMADNSEKAVAPSYMAYGGSSAGGAMNEIPLGGRCNTDGGTLSTVTFWQ